MSPLPFPYRLREYLTSQRFMWILTITFGLVLALYFLFVTMFFNPFEDELDDIAAVVPREVNYFVRWKGAGDCFDSFPMPSIWSEFEDSKAYTELDTAGVLTDWSQTLGVSKILAEFEKFGGKVPVGLSLEGDLLREVAVAGRGQLALDSNFDGMLMFRVSFKVKAGVSMLGFDFVRNKLPSALGIESLGGNRYRLPEFPPFGFQDAYLSRVRDVLILSSREEWLDQARQLSIRAGEDSLSQSSVFSDNVQAHLASGDQPIEIFMRGEAVREILGSMPDKKEGGFLSKAIGSFVSTDMLRYLAGYWLPGQRFEGRFSGDTDLEVLGSFGRTWAESGRMGTKVLKGYAGMVPAESFLFAAISGDPGRVAVQFEQALDVETRRLLDEIVISSGKYQGMADMLGDIGSALRGGIALALRRNDFPASDLDVEHDDSPMPLFVCMGKLRDRDKYLDIVEFFKNNFHRFAEGSGEPKLTKVPLAGGTEGLSFVSPAIPGTGEFVILEIPSKRMVFFSNSFNYLREVAQIVFLDDADPRAKGRKLSLTDGFKGTLAAADSGSNLFLYFQPAMAYSWFDKLAAASARFAFQDEMDNGQFRAWRPEEKSRLRGELFPGIRRLRPAQAQQLDDAVDQALFVRADSQWQQRRAELTGQARAGMLTFRPLGWVGVSLEMGRRHSSLIITGELDLD